MMPQSLIPSDWECCLRKAFRIGKRPYPLDQESWRDGADLYPLLLMMWSKGILS